MTQIKAKVLLVGALPDNLIKMLKEIFPNFKVDKIEPQKCSTDYFLNFLFNFQPHIIFIHYDDYARGWMLFEDLQSKQLPKVCFRQIFNPNLWKDDSEEVKELLKYYIEGMLRELEEKNKQ